MATMFALTSVLGLLTLGQVGQPPRPMLASPPLVLHDFLRDDNGWLGLGEIAKVSRTPAPAPTLHFEYMVSKDNLGALVHPFEPGAFKGAQRFQLSIKTDTDTVLAVMIQEKGGGRFSAMASLPKNLWQSLELAPADFSLGRDKGDPVDSNGKLDIEQIESVSVIDLHAFFIRMAEEAGKALFPGVLAGPRELWLKEFSASAAPLPAATLDGLNRPQMTWISVGGADLKRVNRALSPLKVPSLEVAYQVSAGTLGGIFQPLPAGALTGKTSLFLTLAVLKSATLLVQLEDDLGGKFNAQIEVPGVKVPSTKTLVLSELKPDNDSKRDKLDLARVKQVLILDISGLTESVEQNNTLWLANLEAK
jgi:hypothetical protein